MNVFTRLGNWLDERRVLRKPDLIEIKNNYVKMGEAAAELFNRLDNRIKTLEEKAKELESTSQVIPQTISKEFALNKVRLDRLELLTGLKREAEPAHVKGSPRIE